MDDQISYEGLKDHMVEQVIAASHSTKKDKKLILFGGFDSSGCIVTCFCVVVHGEPYWCSIDCKAAIAAYNNV